MKKFLLTMCVALLSVIAFAQNVVVVLKDGTEVKYAAADIDSIRIEKGIIEEQPTVIPVKETNLRFEYDDTTMTATVTRLDFRGAKKVEIPSHVLYENKVYNVTSIGDYAFSGDIITSVSIPNSITSIGVGAFSGCSSLTNIVIPNSVTEIGSWAFSGCTSLTPGLLIYNNGTKCYGWVGEDSKCVDVAIPNSVTEIGINAFNGCENLTSIEISNSVIEIGIKAFFNCISLTSIVIPNSVTKIGDGAFDYCASLKTARVPLSLKDKIPSNAFPSTCEIEWY